MQGIRRNRSGIFLEQLDSQAARKRLPGQRVARRVMIEQILGKPAAVVVAGAEEQDLRVGGGHNMPLLGVLGGA